VVAVKKGPEWEREDNGNYRVTFWWRDPQGTEKESAIHRVWVYITGVTDHHQNATPQSMQRIDGTNVWCWRVSLSANWRGSYCFIPTTRNDIFPRWRWAQRLTEAYCVKAGGNCCRRPLPIPLIRRAGRAVAVMRCLRWKCRRRPYSPDGIDLKPRFTRSLPAMA
jgi:hypothetical protein